MVLLSVQLTPLGPTMGGVRTPCLMIIQLNLSLFHFPDPTHHLYNLLLLRSEDPEIFPSISMAFLP